MTRNKQIIKIGIYGIYVNVILSMFKAIIGILTNSIAIVLDSVNNLSDVMSAGITIIGAKLAMKKPDKEHPYGHGRVEYFSAVIISVLILFVGLTCMKESIIKIIEPTKPKYTTIALLFIFSTVIVKILLSKYLKERGNELDSSSLIASGIDAMWDSVITFSTLVTAFISICFKINLEGYLGIIISILIVKSSLEILKANINDIIGIRVDKKILTKLKRRINSYEDVLGIHDINMHSYGPSSIIATASIDVIDDMKAKDIHRLTRTISEDVFDRYGIVLTLGIYATNKKEYKVLKKHIYALTKEYEHIIETHGFYVDEELKQVSFDIIFDFKEDNEEQIVNELITKLKEQNDKYDYNIVIDKDI